MTLEELRSQIDTIDRDIVRLIARRVILSREIGALKNEKGMGIEDKNREKTVLESITRLAEQEGMDAAELSNIYRHIIAASKNIQGLTVAFQGEFGAFSESAARAFFGPSIQAVPFESLEEVFRATRKNEVIYGIVPVENSLEGSIDASYDLLLNSNLKVSGEVELKVSHCLIANEGANLSTIRKIYSHPQALGQCQAFIKHLNCQLIPTYDTAGAVKFIKDKGIGDGAAIASSRAAEIYEMSVLARDIQDNPDNYTRFFVLSAQAAAPTGDDKTSVVFAVKHQPGTLSGILNAFADEKVNLTKLESRPTRQKPWEYNFYMDFEGHHNLPGPAGALKRAEEFAIFIKVLGSYPKARQKV
jgi:chorismate mutase/prephenate dehydratase